MTPRNMQLEASASALRAPKLRVPRPIPSRTSPSPRTERPKRPTRPRELSVGVVRSEMTAHRWWLLPVVVVVVVAVFVAAYYPVARVQYRETRQRARLSAELGAIRARNGRLRSDVARLRTPEGVEDYARLQLGMVKKGEHQVVVVDGTESTRALEAQAVPKIDSQETVKPPVGAWSAFFDAFFGLQ